MNGGRGGEISLASLSHAELAPDELMQLRRLFDAEYRDDHGEWDPELPYGYAPHDLHVLARHDGDVVGHVGWARRTIGVGSAEVVIAGVGGVLISPRARGRRLGERLMTLAAQTMREAGDVSHGYLGCREEVAPFYEACGWRRISATELSLARDGSPTR